MIGRLIGSALGFLGASLCGYGLYRIVDMLISGILSTHWLMVIAGGILLYFFGALLLAGVIVLGIIGLAVLFMD